MHSVFCAISLRLSSMSLLSESLQMFDDLLLAIHKLWRDEHTPDDETDRQRKEDGGDRNDVVFEIRDPIDLL